MRVPVRQAVASSSSSSSSDSGVELELRWFARLLLEGKVSVKLNLLTELLEILCHS
jgi:hypothetical protein